MNPRDQLSELLAVIHRDGGHYETEHGTSKALEDAELKYLTMLDEIEKHRWRKWPQEKPSAGDLLVKYKLNEQGSTYFGIMTGYEIEDQAKRNPDVVFLGWKPIE